MPGGQEPATASPAVIPARIAFARIAVATHRQPSGGQTLPANDGALLKQEAIEIDEPAPVGAFNAWLRRFSAASTKDREAMEGQGVALAKARRQAMAELIATRPEDAILLAVPASHRAGLPMAVSDALESIVAGEGFYGVLAICDHDQEGGHTASCRIEYDVALGDAQYKASIYGSRRERLTEENASLYGVALDGKLALHEDDFVVLPGTAVSSDPARADQLALIYKGQTRYFTSEAALTTHLRSLFSP
jgi:hypothetical protein